MQPDFDNLWLRRATSGDSEAIDQLAQHALEPLYRFCFYRLGQNRHLCEDVVQETLVRAVGELAQYDPSRSNSNIFPWLTGLARNEIRRALAREGAAASLDVLWRRMDDSLRTIYAQLESEPLTEEVLMREETREMVGATMSQLPVHYREALEAKYVVGKSVRQMAAEQSKTEKAVEGQLARARKAFRAAFVTLADNLSWEAGT